MLEGIAIVSQSRDVSLRDTTRVAAAVQTQVLRDVRPWWHVSAPVNAFFRLEDVPLGQWPVVIRDDVRPDECGIHRFEGSPVGVAPAADDWSVEVSRLVLDLLLNPDGARRVVGPSPELDQGDVEFVLSPGSIGRGFVYDIQGYPMSDVVYPDYYRGGSGPYSSAGTVADARLVEAGGHLIWWDGGSGRWWLKRWLTGDQPELRGIDIDPDDDLHRQFERLAPRRLTTTPIDIDLRTPAGGRPTGATHRVQRLNDLLNGLDDAGNTPDHAPHR